MPTSKRDVARRPLLPASPFRYVNRVKELLAKKATQDGGGPEVEDYLSYASGVYAKLSPRPRSNGSRVRRFLRRFGGRSTASTSAPQARSVATLTRYRYLRELWMGRWPENQRPTRSLLAGSLSWLWLRAR